MRALLSVYDKTGLVDLAPGLVDLGWELVASGKTAARPGRGAASPTSRWPSVTGAPEMLGGRVKTLHPKDPRRHPGRPLRARAPGRPRAPQGIEPIDLVVCNLYPFTLGPLHRADRRRRAHHGAGRGQEPRPRRRRRRPGRLPRRSSTSCAAPASLSADTRRRLARAAFAHTAAYDAAIVGVVRRRRGRGRGRAAAAHAAPRPGAGRGPALRREPPPARGPLPGRGPSRRGGTGSSSTAARRCRTSTSSTPTPPGGSSTSSAPGADRGRGHHQARQPLRRGGRRRPGRRPTAGPSSATRSRPSAASWPSAGRARRGGPGGGRGPPGRRGRRRRLRARGPRRPRRPGARPPGSSRRRPTAPAALELRSLGGGLPRPGRRPLRDDAGRTGRWPPRRAPTDEQWRDLELAWRVCARTSSNAIVVVARRPGGRHRRRPAEPGRGGRDRRGARPATGPRGGAAASDAFFPFPDGLDVLAAAGVAVVVQPGGSVRDAEVVAAADEHGHGHGAHRRAPLPALSDGRRRDGAHPRRRGAGRPHPGRGRRPGGAAARPRGSVPGSGTILVGDDPPAPATWRMKHADCAEVGIASVHEHLPADVEPGRARGGDRPVQRRPRRPRLPGPAPAARRPRRGGRAAGRGPRQGRRRPAPGEPRPAGDGRSRAAAVHAGGHRRAPRRLRRAGRGPPRGRHRPGPHHRPAPGPAARAQAAGLQRRGDRRAHRGRPTWPSYVRTGRRRGGRGRLAPGSSRPTW